MKSFPLYQAGNRDSRPAFDNPGDFLLGDFIPEEGIFLFGGISSLGAL